jgi:protein SCO1
MARGLHNRTVQTLLIVLAGAVALAIGIGAGQMQGGTTPTQALSLEGGTWLSEPRPLPEFELLDMQGEPFTRTSLEGRWSFVFFGYTYCPDICPLTMALLGSAITEIRRLEPDAADPRVVFVSVDPDRDTPEALSQYVAYFNPEFMGVTAPMEELTPFTRALGILHRKAEDPRDPENYLVDHSASILLINPRGELQAVLSAPHQVQSIASDFLLVRQRFEQG